MCIPPQLSWKLAGVVIRAGRADLHSLLVTHQFLFPLGDHRPVLGGLNMCLCELKKQFDKMLSRVQEQNARSEAL